MRSRKKKESKPKPAKHHVADAAAVDANGWPKGYVDSFTGVPEDFVRPPQGELTERAQFD
jgi:hypothetical protein